MEFTGKKTWLYYSLAFLIPAGVILAIYIINNIYPFGDQTLVFNDAFNQYLTFFDYYRNLMTGKENFFYSFELYLGHGVTGLFAYYLASPFNLLYLLFPQSQTILAYHLIYLLKIGFCGLTAAIFFKYTSRQTVSTLIFTTGYALCSYNIAYGFCYMWIDGVIMLPLIALGIQRIFEGKSAALYLFSLAGVIISNFYIGFILCGFSVLFAVYSGIVNAGSNSKQTLVSVGKYAVSSVLAGGISCVILIPSVLSISKGSSSAFTNIKDYTYPIAVRILDLLHLTGKLSIKAALLLCAGIVCAVGILLCFAFLAKKYSKIIRVVAGVIAVIIIALFYILVERYVKVNEFEIPADSLKNLFFGSVPKDLVYNYAPLIFTGIVPAVFAVLYFFNPEFTEKEKWAAVFALASLILSFAFYIPTLIWHGMQVNHSFNYRYSFVFCFFVVFLGEKAFRRKDRFTVKQVIAVGLGFLACCIFVLLRNSFSSIELITGILSLTVCLAYMLMTGTGKNKTADIALLSVCILALTASGYETLAGESSYSKSSSWIQEKINDGNSVIAGIRNEDSGFYRIRNSEGFLNSNDPLQFDYDGGSSFTSDGNDLTADFCRQDGIRTHMDKYSVRYDESATRALDTLLGFKYCISADPIADYESVSGNVYVNPYALPLAFTAEEGAEIAGMPESGGVFTNLNETWSKLAPSAGEIYTALNVTAELTDGQTLQADLTCDSNEPLYARIFSENVGRVEVMVNGEKVKEETKPYVLEPLYLGQTKTGDQVQVVWHIDGETDLQAVNECIYVESTENLQKAVNTLTETPCTTTVLTDSHIVSRITMDQPRTMVYSVPYDSGWTITVDGTKTDGYAAEGAFTAVDLPAGEHEVDLRYVPEGFAAGLTLTAISLAGAVILLLLEKTKRAGKNSAVRLK